MRAVDDRLLSWVLALAPRARYNLTSSGLSEPDLSATGLDTSFAHFAAEKDEHERLFREAVAETYHAQPENVVVTSGASEAIFIVYSVLGAGRKSIVPLPNYGPMLTVPRSLGMEVKHSLRGASNGRRALFGFTDPNNPTGKMLDNLAVDDLARSSKMTDTTIFINETYKEFAFQRPPNTFFGHHENIVICSTMTKFYGLGRLRVGWILADKQKALQLRRTKLLISGHDSEYSLWIARQALKERASFVKRARKILTENSRITGRFLRETEGVSGKVGGVAPFCLVEYSKGPDSVTLARRIFERTGVLVAPGDFFGARKSFRLCFTSEKGTLEAGLRRLSAFLNGQNGR